MIRKILYTSYPLAQKLLYFLYFDIKFGTILAIEHSTRTDLTPMCGINQKIML